jgi:hypothetical protein
MSTPLSTTPGLQRRQQVGLVLLAASGWVVLGLTALPSGTPVRQVAGFAFLLTCPGAALVRHWPGMDGLERLVLAVALSLSAAMLIAETLILAHAWSTPLALGGLAALTSAAALLPGAERRGVRR